MKNILVSLSVIVFATCFIYSGYAADDSTATKAKNEVNKETNKASSTLSELPGKVKSALASKCPAQDVRNVTKESYQGKAAYEVTCNQNGTTHYILMDKDGKVIRDETTRFKQNNNTQNQK